MRKNICIHIQYDGTAYSGWQRQGNTKNTIENKISVCLSRILNSDNLIEIHGSGRTDAGVHAYCQVANFHIDTDMTPGIIMDYLNKYLPEDIRIIKAFYVDERFHSRLSAVRKKYIYRIDNSKKADVFMRKYAHHISDVLDVDKMKESAKLLVGTHDFMSFSDMKNSKKSTVRTIYDIDIKCNNNNIFIEYEGNGFLYHMVRKLTAAIIEIGLGNMTSEDISVIFEKKDRHAFKLLAPAKGLMLMSVGYE